MMETMATSMLILYLWLHHIVVCVKKGPSDISFLWSACSHGSEHGRYVLSYTKGVCLHICYLDVLQCAPNYMIWNASDLERI